MKPQAIVGLIVLAVLVIVMYLLFTAPRAGMVGYDGLIDECLATCHHPYYSSGEVLECKYQCERILEGVAARPHGLDRATDTEYQLVRNREALS